MICSYMPCMYSSHVILVSPFRVLDRTPQTSPGYGPIYDVYSIILYMYVYVSAL